MYNINAKAKRRQVTVNDGTEKDVKVGETVTAGEYRWERINDITEDQREEPHFDTTFKCNMFHSEATEVEVFRAFMPLDRQTLLNIIRDNADEDGSADKRIWEKWHVDAALAIVFGGAQFREGTDLRATKKVGMMPAPGFGRQFKTILEPRRYFFVSLFLLDISVEVSFL